MKNIKKYELYQKIVNRTKNSNFDNVSIKRIDVMELLNAPGGQNYFESLDYIAICESIKRLYVYLKQKNLSNMNCKSTISQRQYCETMVVLKALEKGDIKNAYHSLWDVVDNMRCGQSYLSMTEHVLLYSLVQNFVIYIGDYEIA